ncbi:MAG: hypothetical protein QM831_42325 [Kofleriaceae bacterium]
MCAVPATGNPVPVDPGTFASALAAAQPGDELQLASGTYIGPFELDASHVILRAADGAAPVIAEDLIVRGSDVEIRGIQFDAQTAGYAWLEVQGAPSDIRLIGNAFDSHAPNRDDGAFVGVALTGDHLTLCGNAFGSWLGDEVSADKVDRMLVEHNDWSQASAEHSLFAIVGHHIVIRDNAFRNPWQRALHITDRSDDDRTDEVVVEHNTFIDSDWKTGSPNPSNEEQNQGGNEVVRFLGARGIFRDNLLAGNHEGDNWDCHGILNFQTFISSAGIDTRRLADFRVYGNTFDSNKTSAIIFYMGQPPLDATNNKFLNNVITNSEHYAFSLCGDGHDVPLDTYRISHNVMPGESVHLNDQTILDVIAAALAMPSVFDQNMNKQPTYTNPGFADGVAADPTSYRLANLDSAFAAYRLTNLSDGAGFSTPLAQVVSSSGATLTVDDALVFSDGEGVVDGDVIDIGGATAMVIARDVDANTITLDHEITVEPGNPIRLAGASIDAGIY